MQTEGKKLKEGADELGIIYSTAKTIWQTFKKEHRIAKKPKRSIGTKKAAKHEEHLYSMLMKTRVPGILAKILHAECSAREGRKRALRKFPSSICGCGPPEETNPLQSVSTRAVANSPVEGCFSRIQSANEIVLVSQDEDGPRFGQRSHGTCCASYGVLDPPTKKDKFYIYADNDLDNKYKEEVDCTNPVSLRRQRKRSGLPSFRSTFTPVTSRKASECANRLGESAPAVAFNFVVYSTRIVTRRVGELPKRENSLELPVPDALMQMTDDGKEERRATTAN